MIVVNFHRGDPDRALENIELEGRDLEVYQANYRNLSRPVLEVSAFNIDLLKVIKIFLDVPTKDCICCRARENCDDG